MNYWLEKGISHTEYALACVLSYVESKLVLELSDRVVARVGSGIVLIAQDKRTI